MKPLMILGVVLILAGIAALVIGQFEFTDTETLVQVGDAEIQAQTTDTVAVPPIAGIAAIAAGVILVAIAKFRGR